MTRRFLGRSYSRIESARLRKRVGQIDTSGLKPMNHRGSSTVYRFGDWRVEPNLNQINRDGVVRRLEARAMDVLVYLIRHHERVVSADELLDALWSGRVVEQSTVHKRINQIRQALDDDPRHPLYVETIVKRGYRAIAEVDPLNEPRRRVASVSEPTHRGVAIAVLPFTNMSDDPEQEYFSDGIAEDILNELAKNAELTVRPRSSSFALKGARMDLQTIGERLNVTHVLEGSVRRSSERVRITAQLSEVTSDRSIWSERYERELTDVFTVQDDVVDRILSALNVQFAGPGPSRHFGIEAYDAFLLGRDHFFRSQFDQSAKWFERAVELDPDYTEAWSFLAQIMAWTTAGGFNPNSGVHLARRQQYIETALDLDPSNARALSIRALLDTFYIDRDYELAVNELIRLVTTHPNNESVHHALWLVLGAIGRVDLQSRVANRLAELSPESFAAQSPRIYSLIEKGALEEARLAVQEYETRFDYPLISLNFALATGDVARLQWTLERAPAGWSIDGLIYSALVPYLKGDYQRAREFVSPLKGIDRYRPHLLRSYIALIERDVDNAFDYHYRAIDQAEPNAIAWARGLPGFRRVFLEFYDHPRHAQMLEDYGLDPDSVAKMKLLELPF